MLKLSIHLLLLLLLSSFSVSAQTGSRSLEKIQPFTLEPHKIIFSEQLPFSSLLVMDSRPDTSKVGYGIKGGYYRKLVLKGSTASQIRQVLTQALNQKLDTSAQQSLLIVIKQLWLSELNTIEIPKRRGVHPGQTPTPQISQCKAKLEVYAQRQDGFVPLFRIDSIFGSGHTLLKDGEKLISAPFAYLLQKLTRLNYTKVAAATQTLTWNQITEFNKKQIHHPILTDSSNERGLYLSYSDFLNNKVTKKEFEVEFGKLTDQLYLVEKNDKRLFMELWGFCDGKKLFIRQGKAFYELVRQGNTFGYLGANGVLPNSGRGNGYIPIGSTPKETLVNTGAHTLTNALINLNDGNGLKPFLLDIETGNSY